MDTINPIVVSEVSTHNSVGADIRMDLGKNVAIETPKLFVEVTDGQCNATFSGPWDGKTVKAAIRSIEKKYQAFKHTITREAARERMRIAAHNGGSEDV